jgi:hypothetical protein
MAGVLRRRGRETNETEAQREDHFEDTSKKWPCLMQGETEPACQYLDLGLPASSTVENEFLYLSYIACGLCYGSQS